MCCRIRCKQLLLRILYELLNEVTAMFCMRVFLHLWYRGESVVFCTFKRRFNTNIGFEKYMGMGGVKQKRLTGVFHIQPHVAFWIKTIGGCS